MKSQCAVAVAIVSWWLIVPPMTSDHSQTIENVPLASWPEFGRFKTEPECEAKKTWLADYMDENMWIEAENRGAILAEIKDRMRCLKIEEVAPAPKANL